MEYGHLENGSIVYAKNPANIGGAIVDNPTAAMYLTIGEKHLDLAEPTDPAPTGYHYEADGYTETATEIAQKWKQVADPVIPRKFSKLKIYGAIAQLGAWTTIQNWIEGKTINGMNGWMAFQLAQEISEDHELFTALAEEARQLLGLDTAAFETLLAACVLED